MMIFDFLIPFGEFASLPGYRVTTFEPLRGIGNYKIIFWHLYNGWNPAGGGEYLHNQWIKG